MSLFTDTTHLPILTKIARVAELVDAADSKSAVRKDVLVRFQSRALMLFLKITIKKADSNVGLFYCKCSRSLLSLNRPADFFACNKSSL